MPELPELQVLVNGLKEELLHQYIYTIESVDPKIESALSVAKGQKIIDILRYGRNIQLQFSEDALIITMSPRGYFMITPDLQRPPGVQFVVRLENSYFMYVDEQGSVLFVKKNETHVPPIGVDPLTKQFNFKYMWREMRKADTNVKRFITNQAVISGIGPVYAKTILTVSKIPATKHIGELSRPQAKRLFWNIKHILRDAIIEKSPDALTDSDDFIPVPVKPGKRREVS